MGIARYTLTVNLPVADEETEEFIQEPDTLEGIFDLLEADSEDEDAVDDEGEMKIFLRAVLR